jgi:hypothetical protein
VNEWISWTAFRKAESQRESGVFLTKGIDEMCGNGDSFIPGARVPEMMFQERMLALVEKRYE